VQAKVGNFLMTKNLSTFAKNPFSYGVILLVFLTLLLSTRFFVPNQPLRPMIYVLFVFVAPVAYILLGVFQSWRVAGINTALLGIFASIMSLHLGRNGAESTYKQLIFTWPIYICMMYAISLAVCIAFNRRKRRENFLKI
jgi:hypothetical protein